MLLFLYKLAITQSKQRKIQQRRDINMVKFKVTTKYHKVTNHLQFRHLTPATPGFVGMDEGESSSSLNGTGHGTVPELNNPRINDATNPTCLETNKNNFHIKIGEKTRTTNHCFFLNPLLGLIQMGLYGSVFECCGLTKTRSAYVIISRLGPPIEVDMPGHASVIFL